MKVLIVEDEQKLADGLQALFEQNGYIADVCYDGISGMDAILSGNCDLVVLDIMLPGMNGIDIMRQIRKEGCRTPVIMLTAKSQIADKVNGLDCGADDYMTKPFDAEELLARVRARTRSEHSHGNDAYTYGDISLDRHTQELKSGERKIKLGHKEYELMEYMIRNAGRILTRDMLISKIWSPDREPDYNHLDVYISFLRKKLKFVHADVGIVTTKNVGYSLEKTE